MSESKEKALGRSFAWDDLSPFRGLFDAPLSSRLPRSPWNKLSNQVWSPAFDVAENDAGFVVTAELRAQRRRT